MISAGAPYCWGANDDGQLGTGKLGHEEQNDVPTRVADLGDVTSIETNAGTTCAVSGGELYCWGDNQLGRSATGRRHSAPRR